MSRELLTAHKVRSISSAGVYRDGGGLRLIVTENGTKRWELWISIKGKRRQLGLGVFPEVSLQAARDEADKIRRAAREGIDLRMQRLAEEARALSFRQAFDTYFTVKRQAAFQREAPRAVAEHDGEVCLPRVRRFARRRGDDCSRTRCPHPDLVRQTRDGEARPPTYRGRFQVSDSARGAREGVAVRRRRRASLGTRHRDVQHHAALPWQEVPGFVALLQRPALRGWPTTRLAFEFLILTATRSNEIRGAVWSEFDLDNAIWTIPKERMKSRKAHRVPLCERCLAILREARALNPDGTLVFEGTKQGRPLSDMTFTKLLRDAGLGESATAHGFRSSFKDWCSERAHVPDEVSEAALAHTIKDRVKAAYLRTDFFDERRSLMEAWATHCQSGRTSSSSRELHISVADEAAGLPL